MATASNRLIAELAELAELPVEKMGKSMAIQDIIGYADTYTLETTLKKFLKWFKSKYGDIRVKRLFLGEQKVDHPTFEKKKLVILLVIDRLNVITEKVYQCDGKTYDIVCKLWKFPPLEGVMVTSRELNCEIDHTMISHIEACIQKRSRNLFVEHSNLEVVSMSVFRSKYNGEKIINEPCIALFCTCKGVVPLNEKEYPKELDGIPTDVREGFFNQLVSTYPLEGSTAFLDPLRMGASINKRDHGLSGTLGGFVTMDSGDIGFITAAHNFHNVCTFARSVESFDVMQPSQEFPGSNVCGTHVLSFGVTNTFNGHTLDAALVRVTSRHPRRGIFAGMTLQQLLGSDYNDGAIRDLRQELSQSKRCIKFGAVTGLTRGKLWTVGMSARWFDIDITFEHLPLQPPVRYFNQLQIIGEQNLSFALHGDSGALVFQVDGDEPQNERLVCIGMVVGFTTDNKTVVTPIAPILEALNVTMHNFNG